MGGPGALGGIAPHGLEPRLAVWESAGRASPKTPEHRVFRESIGHPARGSPGVGEHSEHEDESGWVPSF